MNLEAYPLPFQSQNYDGHISEKIDRWATSMDVYKKSSILKPADLISTLAFLHNFNTVCDSMQSYEETSIWLFPHVMNGPAKATLSYRMSATEDKTTHKEGTLTAYSQINTYLLETYATYDVIAEPKADNTNYEQREIMSAVLYSETVWEKAARSGRV